MGKQKSLVYDLGLGGIFDEPLQDAWDARTAEVGLEEVDKWVHGCQDQFIKWVDSTRNE